MNSKTASKNAKFYANFKTVEKVYKMHQKKIISKTNLTNIKVKKVHILVMFLNVHFVQRKDIFWRWCCLQTSNILQCSCQTLGIHYEYLQYLCIGRYAFLLVIHSICAAPHGTFRYFELCSIA
jgi:hypothetical protein